jgi:SAM-dependent methyltransferase
MSGEALHPRVAKARAAFDEWAKAGEAEGMERHHGPAARRAFERLPLTPESWYLDIGCGNGYTVRWGAQAAPYGRAVGLDVAPAMIARARAMSAPFPNAAFRLAAFPAHDLPAGRFDGIFSMEVFYYLPDIDAALGATRDLLTPAGQFACVVDYYAENAASHDFPSHVDAEMTLWTMAEWRDAFAQSGLRVVDQTRIVLPPAEADEDWQATEGSLLTLGERA